MSKPSRWMLFLTSATSAAMLGVPALAQPTACNTSSLTDPAKIELLTQSAYIWALAPEFAQRDSSYLTLLKGPFNTLTYGAVPAAWNNAAMNAGDSSVLYVSSWLDFSKTSELVLTVPPTARTYYVVSLMDSYLNAYGSIGNRTTPSNTSQSFLLVGPNSRYARLKSAKINGYEIPVVASDTNLNFLLTRVAANTLTPSGLPRSAPETYSQIVQKIALTTLKEFGKNNNQPVYPTTYTYTPTDKQVQKAKIYANIPSDAIEFFKQAGAAIVKSPLPKRGTGLSGRPVALLPSYVVPQYGATSKSRYEVPSFGQKPTLDAFAPLGLTEAGYAVPCNWGPMQLDALQSGFAKGQSNLKKLLSAASASSNTNYWSIVNSVIGTYPNTAEGYFYRASVVVAGGVANVPLDAVYPTTLVANGVQLSGDNTYSITFTPGSSAPLSLPVYGTYPPMVLNKSGTVAGFWSVILYQPASSQASAPFLSQASLLNTYYSKADTLVASVDAQSNTITAQAPGWGNLILSTPIIFNANAANYGLVEGKVYYVASQPVSVGGGKYSFSISDKWLQELSTEGVPIQDSGAPGAIVPLSQGSGDLYYGPVKPVSQLGSAQLDAGQLKLNDDRSLTLWLSPTLPEGVPKSNWIPTPSTAHLQGLYPGKTVSANVEVMLRMYYPTPGDQPPSILPYTSGATSLPESYVPPSLVEH